MPLRIGARHVAHERAVGTARAVYEEGEMGSNRTVGFGTNEGAEAELVDQIMQRRLVGGGECRWNVHRLLAWPSRSILPERLLSLGPDRSAIQTNVPQHTVIERRQVPTRLRPMRPCRQHFHSGGGDAQDGPTGRLECRLGRERPRTPGVTGFQYCMHTIPPFRRRFALIVAE